MQRNGLVPIKFKHRVASNTSDKRIADAYVKGARFDVDLVTADEKIVSAHRFVLTMFSKYLAKQLTDAGIDGVIIVPLTEFSYDVVKKVVELLYFREINVTPDLHPNVMKAVNFLKIADIDDVIPVEPMQQQTLPQVISQGASQNSGMNPNRIMLQQQPAKPAINVQDGAYAPAKRVVRSQSIAVGSMPNGGQRIIHPGRTSLNLSSQMTITKAPPQQQQQQQRPIILNVGHPQVPNQLSNQIIGQVQIKGIPKQNGSVGQNPTQSILRQSPMKIVTPQKAQPSPLNTMLPPSMTIVPKTIKANTIVQQQQQQHQQQQQKLQQQVQLNVPPANPNALSQNVSNVGDPSAIDEDDNLLDEDMDIDETVNDVGIVERKPKVEIISDEIIKPANQHVVNGDSGGGNGYSNGYFNGKDDENLSDEAHENENHTELDEDEYYEDDENNNDGKDDLCDIFPGKFDVKTEA